MVAITSFSLASTLVLLFFHFSLNLAVPTVSTAGNEATLESRGGGSDVAGNLFNSVVIGLATTEAQSGLLKAFGASSPTCCDSYPATSGCLFNAGTDQVGNPWMACYFPGTETIYDFDVEAMNCIINLHYTQDDACIDIAGSVCAQGYGGGLMAGQMSWIGKGHAKADQISAAQSVTYQAAAASMKGIEISYANGSSVGKGAIDLELVDPKAGDFALTEGMYFDGHMGGDC
ncbi:hypothetical protein P7C71_g252, partial [Lecanoromycetidae sp. Uapishka_2]